MSTLSLYQCYCYINAITYLYTSLRKDRLNHQVEIIYNYNKNIYHRTSIVSLLSRSKFLNLIMIHQ